MDRDVDNSRRQVEEALRRWLRAHHGVISWWEARRCGATAAMVQTKLARGEWARLGRGVFRDTAVPESIHQMLRAARVATKGRAVASHASAAWLWGLVPQPPTRAEVSVPRPCHPRLLGLIIHRSADLDPRRVVVRNGIHTTDARRTLVDLGASVPRRVLTDAVDRALSARLVTVPALTAEAERLAHHGRAGPGILRTVLLERGFIGAPHPSVLESRALRLIHGAGLPRPNPELHAGRDGQYRIDFAYPDLWLAVEVDGYAWHSSPDQVRRDNTRRNHLRRQGWLLQIYTWKEIVHEPARVANEIADAYAGALSAASRPAGTAAGGSSPPRRTRGPAPGSREAAPAPPSGSRAARRPPGH